MGQAIRISVFINSYMDLLSLFLEPFSPVGEKGFIWGLNISQNFVINLNLRPQVFGFLLVLLIPAIFPNNAFASAVSSGGSTQSFKTPSLSPSAPAVEPPLKPSDPGEVEMKSIPSKANPVLPKPTVPAKPPPKATPKPPAPIKVTPPAKPVPKAVPKPNPVSPKPPIKPPISPFPTIPRPAPGKPNLMLPPSPSLPPSGMITPQLTSPGLPTPGLPPPLPDMRFLDFKPGFSSVMGWDPEEFPEALSGQAILEADKIEHRKSVGDVRAEGDAYYKFRELSLSAPILYVHESRELVHAKGGGVKLHFRGHRLEAEELYTDFREKSLKARTNVVMIRRKPPESSESVSLPSEEDGDNERPIVRSLKKRTTQMYTQNLDIYWEKGQETLSASGGVLVEQPKWLMVSKSLRANDKDGTLSAIGDVVLTLSDSRWLIEEEVLPATNLSLAVQDESVKVSSPQMDHDEKKGITFFHGPVLMEMPKKVLRSRAITVHEGQNTVFFDGFDYQQEESRWLIDRGVISSNPPDRIDAQLDRPMTALSATALYDRANKRLTMEGSVTIRQGSQWMKADKLVYDETAKKLELFGNAEVHDETTREFLKGELLVYNEESGKFEASGRVRINIKNQEIETP